MEPQETPAEIQYALERHEKGVQTNIEETEPIDIGDPAHPKMLQIGKKLSLTLKSQMTEFKNILMCLLGHTRICPGSTRTW